MAETKVLDEVRELIGRRLDELDAEQRRLQRAPAELDGEASGRSAGRSRGRRSAVAPPRM